MRRVLPRLCAASAHVADERQYGHEPEEPSVHAVHEFEAEGEWHAGECLYEGESTQAVAE